MARCPHQGLTKSPDPPDSRPDPLAELTARDLLRVLEEEVQRLPQAHRLPVVLCCLNARASAIPGFEYGAQRQAQQVVARRFLYTTPVDTEDRAGGRLRRFRSHDHEPVWFVEFAGVNLPPPKGPPEPPRLPRDDRPGVAAPPQPNIERVEQRFDARTGQFFTTAGSP